MQGDPTEWVSSHRFHHLHTDTPLDPHSPYEGFWWSHMGWLLDEKVCLLTLCWGTSHSVLLEVVAAPWNAAVRRSSLLRLCGLSLLYVRELIVSNFQGRTTKLGFELRANSR